jgi:hypothetical protein
MSSLSISQIDKVLNEYINQIVQTLYREDYHLRLAKGGPDYTYLSEQSFLGHILNGVFGLVGVLKFVVKQNVFVYGLDESLVRKALALYTIHDLHKFDDYKKIGNSEFSIPLNRLREEYKRLQLIEFAGELDENLMREGNVSKRSKHHGDLLLSTEDHVAKLWVLVRIADTMTSVANPTEGAVSIQGYLRDLSTELKTQWQLYTHELQDVRGILTNLVHNAVHTSLVKRFKFQELLYFSSGTLYIGSKEIDECSRENFIEDVVSNVLNSLKPLPEMAKSSAAEGLRREKFDFQPYVYTFADIEDLLGIVLEETQRTKPKAKEVIDDVAQIAGKKNAPQGWADTFEDRFSVSLSESKDFNERWYLARRYLLYVDTLLKALAPQRDRLAWYVQTYCVPEQVLEELRKDEKLFASGGVGKHILIPAFHFLKGADFAERSAEAWAFADVLQKLHDRTVIAFKELDIKPGREAVASGLGFRQDLTIYLNEQLSLSFAPETNLSDDALVAYSARKKKGHSSRLCSICNRSSDYVQDLRTDTLGDFGRVFSNRVLPDQESPGKNRPWCPICHLEFILRKFSGLAVSNYGQSYRINLYILPTFSFTPEHARLFGRMLRPLQEVTALPIRDYGKTAPGLPRLWLERRELDPEWLDTIIDVFTREAKRIAEKPAYFGDRLLTAKATPQPNYYLVPWERSVREREQDDARVPTRTEAWAKATFTASVIAGLTNSRVYVTERPYLPFTSASELKATVTLDSPPPIITKLLGNEQDAKLANRSDTISLYGVEDKHESGLERALDLCAALWVVTSEVHRPDSQTKDKQIADRLGTVAVEPLAGAHFYKEFGRLNDDASPFPILTKACETLLQYFGSDLMDLVEQITEKGLEIRLPFRGAGRGKAHNYELVFREAVDAIRSAFKLVPELRQLALSAEEPSAEALAELKKQASGTLLKAMERRRTTKRGDGLINPWQSDLGKLVGEFIDLVVDEVFLIRADKSFAQFLRIENSLADGIYYCTDRTLDQKWKTYKEAKSQTDSAA